MPRTPEQVCQLIPVTLEEAARILIACQSDDRMAELIAFETAVHFVNDGMKLTDVILVANVFYTTVEAAIGITAMQKPVWQRIYDDN